MGSTPTQEAATKLRNAATLFVEAFPLQDPTKPMVELDTLLQMQFEVFKQALRTSLSELAQEEGMEVPVAAAAAAVAAAALVAHTQRALAWPGSRRHPPWPRMGDVRPVTTQLRELKAWNTSGVMHAHCGGWCEFKWRV